MSGARSRNKGARGELELARLLRSEGFPATRGQQHRGGPGSPDVLCSSLPSIHSRTFLVGGQEMTGADASRRVSKATITQLRALYDASVARRV